MTMTIFREDNRRRRRRQQPLLLFSNALCWTNMVSISRGVVLLYCYYHFCYCEYSLRSNYHSHSSSKYNAVVYGKNETNALDVMYLLCGLLGMYDDYCYYNYNRFNDIALLLRKELIRQALVATGPISLANALSYGTAPLTGRARTVRYFTNHTVIPMLVPVQEHPVSSSSSSSLVPNDNKIPTKNNQSLLGINNPMGLSVTYTNNPSTVSQWLSQHVSTKSSNNGSSKSNRSSSSLLGFDLESSPEVPWRRTSSFYGPAVVQLATPDSALVVHLARSSGRFCRDCQPILEAVLADPTIIIVGCGIDLDLVELRSVWPQLEARSRLDLGGLRSHAQDNVPGLQTLALSVLGVELPKSRRITCSDWSQVPLSDEQIMYAARDAWVGAAVIQEITQQTTNPDVWEPKRLIQQLLQSQPSIAELYQRQRNRKCAKLILKSLLEAYDAETRQKAFRGTETGSLPPWKVQMVRKLRNVMNENKHGKVETFVDMDRSLLGIGSNRSTNNSTACVR